MSKIYRIVATEIDTDTNEEKEVLNDEYEGFTLYGDQGETFSEVMMHENIIGLASKLAQGKKSVIAMRLARVLEMAKDSDISDMEDDLLNMLRGGDE